MRNRSKFEFAFVSTFFWPFFAVSFKLRRRYFEEGFGGEGASIYGARSANRTVQEGGPFLADFRFYV